MMYISFLLIDVGSNPDRPRPGRRWLNNIYHVHQRLSMAFPFKETKESDSYFLKPYKKEKFEKARFLFRIDNLLLDNTARAGIIIQSDITPDWNYAFQNTNFLAAVPQIKRYEPKFNQGEELKFRILLNLSKRSFKYRNEKNQGKRISMLMVNDDLERSIDDWLHKKTENKGFEILNSELIYTGWKYGSKRFKISENQTNLHYIKIFVGLFEGVLKVKEPEKFFQTLKNGIGSAKSFGCGLLTVGRI